MDRHAAGIARTLGTIAPVLLVLAASNLIVLLAVNPFRQDRLPDHLPAILQDAITVALFATVVVLFFNDRLQLTAAAGAVVLGLALQNTLGNAIAGLALQADQPYKVGDWIRVGDHEGRVTQISWRSTHAAHPREHARGAAQQQHRRRADRQLLGAGAADADLRSMSACPTPRRPTT